MDDRVDSLIAAVQGLSKTVMELGERVADIEAALAVADGDHFNPEARHMAFVERLRAQGKVLPLRR